MPGKAGSSTGSQTLGRGIRLLEILADAGRSMTIDELAGSLGVHRSVAYRLLRTLEDHGLIAREATGRIMLGAGLAALAAGVSHDLQQAALPELKAAANELGMTCLLVVAHDGAEAVTLISAAPQQSVAVAYRPGHRHPLTRGAPGKAILLERDDKLWPADLREELTLAGTRGFATSHGEVVPSLWSVAVPLMIPGQPDASIAAIHVSLPRSEPEIAERLGTAAKAIARALGG
ncbi:IclR family transcriptional regulator [Nocardia miyunensis]|uniref:IclR family transcriptional regulator n=1 Tax=Nocardia miyunensis TaxID=282684 RepID=UPI0008305E1D|nr:helix-turn-helix domain-containing protein [Nocardia miyunensis]